MEMGIKSKEARKYIFNCLDDMMQVDVSSSNLFWSRVRGSHCLLKGRCNI